MKHMNLSRSKWSRLIKMKGTPTSIKKILPTILTLYSQLYKKSLTIPSISISNQKTKQHIETTNSSKEVLPTNRSPRKIKSIYTPLHKSLEHANAVTVSPNLRRKSKDLYSSLKVN